MGFDSCCEELLVLVVSNWVLCKDLIFGVCDFICDVGFVFWIFFFNVLILSCIDIVIFVLWLKGVSWVCSILKLYWVGGWW